MIFWIFLAGALALLGLHLASVAITLRRLAGPARAEGALIGVPPITLIRPLCGLNAFEEETLESSFHLSYPAYDLIFCVEDAADPVLPLIRALIARHPQVPAQVLVGFDRVTDNPKLNNLWKGWQAAQSDWVCLADSNLMLPKDYLEQVAACWGPDTGAVSSPPVAIRPEGWGGALEAAFLNSNQARLQLVIDSLGNGFAQGKTLFFNKPLLNRAGGLKALGRWLAEDVATTHVVRALGAQVRLTPHPFAQPIGARRFDEVWGRQLRWSRVRRDGFPVLFLAEPLNGALIPVTLAGLAAAGLGLGALPVLTYLALWYLAEVVLLWRADWPRGLRTLACLPLRDLLLPALWGATFLRRGFEWRGKALEKPHAAPDAAQHSASQHGPSGAPRAAVAAE